MNTCGRAEIFKGEWARFCHHCTLPGNCRKANLERAIFGETREKRERHPLVAGQYMLFEE